MQQRLYVILFVAWLALASCTASVGSTPGPPASDGDLPPDLARPRSDAAVADLHPAEDDALPRADVQPGQSRPNFLVIVADDQRYLATETEQTISPRFMPLTLSRVFDAGVQFSRAYVTTAVCCPSRASIYTGNYVRHHKVYTNTDVYDQQANTSVAKRLHNAGYFTGMVGKWLNSNPADQMFPEFDLWAEHVKGEQSYFDDTVYDNFTLPARERQTKGYHTEVMAAYVTGDGQFLDRARASGKPFLLFFNPRNPHNPAEPATQDAALYGTLGKYRPPSYNEADVADKPAYIQAKPLLSAAERDVIDQFRLSQLRTLASLDRAVAQILDKLAANGQLDDTVVFYISDNGMFWGEHRFDQGKARLYEQATHVPFAILGGARTALGGIQGTEDHLVANIDIAPTIMELAGVNVGAGVDGASLMPLLNKTAAGSWRADLLLEAFNATPSVGIRTGAKDEAYYENQGDASEYYDFKGDTCAADPWQLENRSGKPCAQARPNTLAKRLADYCTSVPGKHWSCP